MAPDKIQELVDAEEAEATERYEGRRRIASIVDAAAKRADSVSRLEAWLRDHPTQSDPPPQAA